MYKTAALGLEPVTNVGLPATVDSWPVGVPSHEKCSRQQGEKVLVSVIVK